MGDSSISLVGSMAALPITKFSIFHPFPRLPFELRHRIWEYSTQPRFITIKQIDNFASHEYDKKIAGYVDTNDEKFGLLHACAESKRFVETTYTLVLGTAGSKGIYVDITKDTLYFSAHLLLWGDVSQNVFLAQFSEFMNTIQHIAVQDMLLYRRMWSDLSKHSIEMKELRTFLLIQEKRRGSSGLPDEPMNVFLKAICGFVKQDFEEALKGSSKEDNRKYVQFARGVVIENRLGEVILEEPGKQPSQFDFGQVNGHIRRAP